MKHRPTTRVFRTRVVTTLLCALLLLLGSGCVSWDPIFRGSVRVVTLLQNLI